MGTARRVGERSPTPLAPEAIVRLNLGRLFLPGLRIQIPVHGFLVKHPGGAGLIDTGYGTNVELIREYRAVEVPIVAALRQHEAALAAGAIVVVDEKKSRVRVLPL